MYVQLVKLILLRFIVKNMVELNQLEIKIFAQIQRDKIAKCLINTSESSLVPRPRLPKLRQRGPGINRLAHAPTFPKYLGNRIPTVHLRVTLTSAAVTSGYLSIPSRNG